MAVPKFQPYFCEGCPFAGDIPAGTVPTFGMIEGGDTTGLPCVFLGDNELRISNGIVNTRDTESIPTGDDIFNIMLKCNSPTGNNCLLEDADYAPYRFNAEIRRAITLSLLNSLKGVQMLGEVEWKDNENQD